MRSEGWSVQLNGDHLVASRKEAGRTRKLTISVDGQGRPYMTEA
jgi:hypothetical protein